MENIKIYKLKNEYLNNFLIQNKIIIMKAKKNDNQITYHTLKYKDNDYIILLIDDKIKNVKRKLHLEKLVQHILNQIKLPEYYYTDIRLNFNKCSKIYLSKKINIKIRKMDYNVKNILIIYHYYKLKELIKRQGFKNFFKQYKLANMKQEITKVCEYAKGSIDDYTYIAMIKNIIHIYKKEVDSKIDYMNPSFEEKMIFKYFDNYFSKIAIIEYDKTKIKKFILDYYVTDLQSEDRIVEFINNFIEFYKVITNINFRYENKYKFKIDDCIPLDYIKATDIKYLNFYNKFDNIMNNKNNYFNFMFLLELLDLSKFKSNKNKIINYLSVFELLVVNGDRNISNQLQNKCIMLLHNQNYSKSEIKLAYDYRSKTIHGEYHEANNKLHLISENENYKTDEYEHNETYLNFEQIIEKKLCDRLYKILKKMLRKFVYNNKYILDLKVK